MADAKSTTCSVETCERAVWSKGICNGHYNRLRKTGSTSRPCPTCGNDLPLRKGLRYCSESCTPECCVDGCIRLADVGESCAAHATRKSRYGSYSKLCQGCGNEIPVSSNAKRYCSDGCAPRCESDGCNNRATALGYCGSHNFRRRSNGSDLRHCRACGEPMGLVRGNKFYCLGKCYESCSAKGCDRRIYRNKLCDAHFSTSLPETPNWVGSLKFRDFATGCKACGHPIGADGTAGCCSQSCYSYWYNNGIASQDVVRDCSRCGSTFNLLDGPGVRRRPLTTTQCLACKSRKTNYRKHIPTLLERSGSCCAICKDPIDLGVKYPDPNSLSVDHIIPWSQGGTDDAANLRVTHLLCNSLRQDKADAA